MQEKTEVQRGELGVWGHFCLGAIIDFRENSWEVEPLTALGLRDGNWNPGFSKG